MITLHEAVYSAYPNATFVSGNDVNSIVSLDVNSLPITVVPSIVTNKLSELQAAETVAQQAQATAKASAISKLTALGLTQDEINALIG